MKVMIKAAADLKRYGGNETSLLHKLWWWWSIRLVRYYLIAFRALTQPIHVQGTSSCALRCNTSTPVRMICRGWCHFFILMRALLHGQLDIMMTMSTTSIPPASANDKLSTSLHCDYYQNPLSCMCRLVSMNVSPPRPWLHRNVYTLSRPGGGEEEVVLVVVRSSGGGRGSHSVSHSETFYSSVLLLLLLLLQL